MFSLFMLITTVIAYISGDMSSTLQKVVGADARNKTDVKSQWDPATVSHEIDHLLNQSFLESKVVVAPIANDEDFLRRVGFDLQGQPPTPSQVTRFVLDPNRSKRDELIDQYVSSPEFATNWGRYWRDVIYSRATSMRSRISQGVFEQWLIGEINKNVSWKQIVTEMLTAMGDVRENGATGLLMAHEGEPEELAAETSRIFLGIQIQCANCHDHPSDIWKRQQFHELAAFFPRVRVQQQMGDVRTFEVMSLNVARPNGPQFLANPQRIFMFADRNRDQKLSKEEAQNTPLQRIFERALQVADTDGDGMLTVEEIKAMPAPMMNANRNRIEHFMPDLNDPTSTGTLTQPAFFVNHQTVKPGLTDLERRETLANMITSTNNEWFAKAFVNRIWTEMLGVGFYGPVDDIGPSRTAINPDVLDQLANGFKASNYDMKWLFKTIARTEAYQREIRPVDPSGDTPAFVAQTPTRLRSDQIYNSLVMVTGRNPEDEGPGPRDQRMGMNGNRGPRSQFAELFGFDPSTPKNELTGDIPQSLFMMNSSQVGMLSSANFRTPLGRILQQNRQDPDAISELYLLVLQREPTADEADVALKYVCDIGERPELYEDLMWALINSTEFVTKR
jgi:hypothetical protein